MTEIANILDAEKNLDGIALTVFDLDDTLYSEKEYVRSGFKAAAPERFDELWQAFLNGQPAFDTVLGEGAKAALETYRSHKPNISLYPGVRAMLERIKASGRKLAMVTDGRPGGQRNKIAALEIEELFDRIIITDELGGIEFRKPCSLAFEMLQREFKLPFEKMAYIGDNKKKDFIASEKLGMKSIYFKNNGGLYI